MLGLLVLIDANEGTDHVPNRDASEDVADVFHINHLSANITLP